MKNLAIILIVMLAFASCKEDENQKVDNSKTVYWFNVDLDMFGEKSESMGYQINKVLDDAIAGNYDQFTIIQRNNLRSNIIAIGPFYSKTALKEAQFLFKQRLRKGKVTAKKERKLYWYAIRFNKTEDNEIEITETPVSVIETSRKLFYDYFKESSSVKILPIGPFYNEEAAKASRQINTSL